MIIITVIRAYVKHVLRAVPADIALFEKINLFCTKTTKNTRPNALNL